MCGNGGIWKPSVLSAQFCYEFKTALKNKVYNIHAHAHTWLFGKKGVAHTLEHWTCSIIEGEVKINEACKETGRKLF